MLLVIFSCKLIIEVNQYKHFITAQQVHDVEMTSY